MLYSLLNLSTCSSLVDKYYFVNIHVAVGLLTTLISLYVFGVGGVGWIPLDTECTPITVSQLSTLSLTTTSAPLARLPSMS